MKEQIISDSIRKTIKTAFARIGYTEAMISSDVHFVGKSGKPFFADLVAYSGSLRKDTDTAVISVKGVDNTAGVEHDKDIAPFLALATPIIILVEYKKTPHTDAPRLLITGLNKDTDMASSRKVRDEVVPLSRFEEYLRKNQAEFTPRRLERVKWYSEQFSLFDICPDLMGTAYQIATEELIDGFEKGVRIVLDQNRDQKYTQNIIHAAIAVLAARILRDRLPADWPITAGVNTFLKYAEGFLPGYFQFPSGIAKKLDPLLEGYLHSALDFSQVTLDMVGKFYEKAFVTKEIRDRWGIHYTRSLLAKTLLKRMPIEEIPPDRRIVADPTCGSGSLLAAAYERLSDATYRRLSNAERHQKMISSIFGNDKDGFAAQVARMTLMLFHPPHNNNWKVTKLDVEDDDFKERWLSELGVTPTILVANPPFGEKGGGAAHPGVPRARNQIDRSGLILEKCLDILPDGGLLGIILTETILDQQLATSLRNRVVKECQILEQWSVPPAWFDNVNRPAMAWILRKKAPSSRFVHVLPLSDVPVPNRDVQPRGIINIDMQSPPDRLVPSLFDDLLRKIEQRFSLIKDFYSIWSGLQTNKENVEWSKTDDAHPWSGTNARGTDPFSDFSNGSKGWIELKDSNFHPKGPRRKLRDEHLIINDPMVMLRANRNVPLLNYKWSSIALIDVPEGNRKIVAPSENFLAAFSKEQRIEDKQNYIYSLWAILNHPIASLWFHERFVVTKITTDNFENFPLPMQWTDTEKIRLLASLAKSLLVKMRAFQKKAPEIEHLVSDIDNLIFEMYELTRGERRQIEVWFDGEPRPGLADYCGVKQSKNETGLAEQIVYDSPIWETTFETLDIDFEKSFIKVALDGFVDNRDEVAFDQNGVWVKMIPAMPGWCMRQGATGWIELTTHNTEKLNQSPEQYIVSFRLHKNAYKTQEEIDKKLYLASDIKSKKVVS